MSDKNRTYLITPTGLQVGSGKNILHTYRGTYSSRFCFTIRSHTTQRCRSTKILPTLLQVVQNRNGRQGTRSPQSVSIGVTICLYFSAEIRSAKLTFSGTVFVLMSGATEQVLADPSTFNKRCSRISHSHLKPYCLSCSTMTFPVLQRVR